MTTRQSVAFCVPPPPGGGWTTWVTRVFSSKSFTRDQPRLGGDLSSSGAGPATEGSPRDEGALGSSRPATFGKYLRTPRPVKVPLRTHRVRSARPRREKKRRRNGPGGEGRHPRRQRFLPQ